MNKESKTTEQQCNKQNVSKRTYSNSVYRNKVDREWIVVVDKELSKTKIQMRHGEIWSKNRLSRYWEYVC